MVDLFESVEECGCAAKVPARDLKNLLMGIDMPSDPDVIVGPDTLDDAGVYRIHEDRYLVQTVDFFPPVARQPEDYGRIAAANALSDIYAMGGTPRTALAIVCFPSGLLKQGLLSAVTKGAVSALREAGCTLLGGHSVVDPQPKFGLAVTGIVDPEVMFTNANARPGDVLILTKPLGTGTTIMAIQAQMATADQERIANETMATLNRVAADLGREFGVRAVTDITGFGLLGHGMQMARASGVGFEIEIAGIPFLDDVFRFAESGLLSAAAYTNREYVGDAVLFDGDVPLPVQDVLFDPQTSGGLLMACPPDRAVALLERVREVLTTPCGVVGRVVAARTSGPIMIVKMGQ